MSTPTVSVVVLSRGNRPAELSRCLESMRGQRGVTLDLVCIGNGWQPEHLGPDVAAHALAENLGAPAARNVGARLSDGELIFFLDDDAWADDPQLLRRAGELFAAHPRLGAVQLRVSDADGRTLRRWVPRARVGDATLSGPAFALAEGVTIVRRTAFEQIGGWADEFFFGHEGIDLAWRLWDADWCVRYAGDLDVHHPATAPDRHAVFYRNNARNRVWVARRNLPAVLVPCYLGVWSLITVLRLARQPKAMREWCGGFVEGWRTSPGRRRPMRWRTVARLTRLGQPPII